MVREHRLVGGDEVLARRQRTARNGERGSVRSADQLDDHVGIATRDQFGGIVAPGEAGEIDAAIARLVTRRNRDDLDRAAGAALDQRAVLVEQLDDAAADGAEAGERHAQWFGHVIP